MQKKGEESLFMLQVIQVKTSDGGKTHRPVSVSTVLFACTDVAMTFRSKDLHCRDYLAVYSENNFETSGLFLLRNWEKVSTFIKGINN